MAFLLIDPADTARTLFVLGDPLQVSYNSGGGVVRLPKPAAVTVTPDDLDFTGTHSAVVDAVSYEWRRIGTTTTAWAATAALAFNGTVPGDGTYSVQVRAVDSEGVRGFAKTSATWEVGGGALTILASGTGIGADMDSFERLGAAGYTGNGDGTALQREAAADVYRIHYQGGSGAARLRLEETPTDCALVAPGVPSVTPGEGVFSATFSAIGITASLLRYEYRLDGAGGWTSNGTSTTITDASASSGSHVLNVRAVSTSGVAGATATSASFDVEAGTLAFLDSVSVDGTTGDVVTTGAIDTTGGSFLVATVFGLSLPTNLTDSKSNTWVLAASAATGGVTAGVYACYSPTVGSGHTFTINGTAIYSGLCVSVYSGAAMAFEDDSGAAGTQPGTITPAGDGRLLVCAWGRNESATLTISAGFTIREQTGYHPGLGLEVALADEIQTSATARNPTTNSEYATVMACFAPA